MELLSGRRTDVGMWRGAENLTTQVERGSRGWTPHCRALVLLIFAMVVVNMFLFWTGFIPTSSSVMTPGKFRGKHGSTVRCARCHLSARHSTRTVCSPPLNFQKRIAVLHQYTRGLNVKIVYSDFKVMNRYGIKSRQDVLIVHPTEIRTSISPSSAVKLNTTSALDNYATEEGEGVESPVGRAEQQQVGDCEEGLERALVEFFNSF
uniref:Uncharacterized protein n=1 Tax=Timema monikensis TaxID=170555 RepID=A0A7R9HK97_9NEOP|nr:unnamed protein product [Timema monikensis]